MTVYTIKKNYLVETIFEDGIDIFGQELKFTDQRDIFVIVGFEACDCDGCAKTWNETVCFYRNINSQDLVIKLQDYSNNLKTTLCEVDRICFTIRYFEELPSGPLNQPRKYI